MRKDETVLENGGDCWCAYRAALKAEMGERETKSNKKRANLLGLIRKNKTKKQHKAKQETEPN